MGYLHSLLLSQPTVTVTAWVARVYQWLVIDSGLWGWIAQQNQAMESGGNVVAAGLSAGSRWLASALQEYLMATVYVAVVTLILVLSIPLFLMVVLVGEICGALARRMNPALFITMPNASLNQRSMCPVWFICRGHRQCTQI